MKYKVLKISIAVATLTPCSAEYTCKCTTTDSSGNEIGTSSLNYQASQSDAESICNANESSTSTTITSCKLK